jgi:hypothetical protein
VYLYPPLGLAVDLKGIYYLAIDPILVALAHYVERDKLDLVPQELSDSQWRHQLRSAYSHALGELANYMWHHEKELRAEAPEVLQALYQMHQLKHHRLIPPPEPRTALAATSNATEIEALVDELHRSRGTAYGLDYVYDLESDRFAVTYGPLNELRTALSRWAKRREADSPGVKSAADTEATKPLVKDDRKRAKRSTNRGAARVKIIAGLTAHHQYENGGCTRLDPVGVRELAGRLDISPDSVSRFFAKEFGDDRGYAGYEATCRDAPTLAAWLKMLNIDYSPHPLFGRNPRGEGHSEGE